MVTHSSILAWKTPWTEEPGELQSMRLQSQTRLSTDSECKEHLWDPCSPPPLPPPAHPPGGDSGLSRASPLLSQMCQVHEPVWGFRVKLPLWTKPHWTVRVSVPIEAGTRTQNRVLPSQRSARSLPTLKEGPSGQPPLESRAESTGAQHHCGQIGLGQVRDHLPPGSKSL